MSYHIGIDPGANGCIAIVETGGVLRDYFNLKGKTEHDIATWLVEWDSAKEAVIERVGAMPGNGVASMFKFGQVYGFLRGLLVAMHIPFRDVTPSVWQRDMRCLSKGDKNATKAAAQRLWPSNTFTHANADACLIAEWGRRTKE